MSGLGEILALVRGSRSLGQRGVQAEFPNYGSRGSRRLAPTRNLCWACGGGIPEDRVTCAACERHLPAPGRAASHPH